MLVKVRESLWQCHNSGMNTIKAHGVAMKRHGDCCVHYLPYTWVCMAVPVALALPWVLTANAMAPLCELMVFYDLSRAFMVLP